MQLAESQIHNTDGIADKSSCEADRRNLLTNNIKRKEKSRRGISLSQRYVRKKITTLSMVAYWVNKFKNNLLIQSYILRDRYSKYLEEKYILEDTEENNFQVRLTNTQHPILRMIHKYFRNLNLIQNLLSLWLYPFLSCFAIEISELYLVIAMIQVIIIVSNLIVKIHKQRLEIKSVSISLILNQQTYSEHLFLILWLILILSEQFPSQLLTMIYVILQIRTLYIEIQDRYEEICLKGTLKNILDLLILVLIIYFFAHITACFWYRISANSMYLGESWIHANHMIDQNTWIVYNLAFYWATMTMTTIGYGDVSAKNYIEVAFSNIIMILSSCIFAYSMKKIGLIITSINEQNLKYKQSLLMINEYMKNHNVSMKIQSQVRNCLKYLMNQKYHSDQAEIDEIIDKLPQFLQNEINEDIQGKLFVQFKELDKFSVQAKKQLQTIIQFSQFTPNEIIYRADAQSDECLYLLLDGEVNLTEMNSQKIFKTLKPNDRFGQYQFFTGFNPENYAISVGFSKVCKVQRSQAISKLQRFESDYHYYRDICEQLSHYHNYSLIKQSCVICKSRYHDAIHCPIIVFKPDPLKIIQEYQSQTNKRMRFTRTIGQRVNAWELFHWSQVQMGTDTYMSSVSFDAKAQLDDAVGTLNDYTLQDHALLVEDPLSPYGQVMKHQQSFKKPKGMPQNLDTISQKTGFDFIKT